MHCLSFIAVRITAASAGSLCEEAAVLNDMMIGRRSSCHIKLWCFFDGILRFGKGHAFLKTFIKAHYHHQQHHNDVPEGLGVFPVPRSSRCSWSLHFFLGRPMFLRPFCVHPLYVF